MKAENTVFKLKMKTENTVFKNKKGNHEIVLSLQIILFFNLLFSIIYNNNKY